MDCQGGVLLRHILELYGPDGTLEYYGPIPPQARLSALKFLIQENERINLKGARQWPRTKQLLPSRRRLQRT